MDEIATMGGNMFRDPMLEVVASAGLDSHDGGNGSGAEPAGWRDMMFEDALKSELCGASALPPSRTDTQSLAPALRLSMDGLTVAVRRGSQHKGKYATAHATFPRVAGEFGRWYFELFRRRTGAILKAYRLGSTCHERVDFLGAVERRRVGLVVDSSTLGSRGVAMSGIAQGC